MSNNVSHQPHAGSKEIFLQYLLMVTVIIKGMPNEMASYYWQADMY